MADLAGRKAIAGGIGGPLGVEAMARRCRPAWHGIVVAGCGEAVDLGGTSGQILTVAGSALVGVAQGLGRVGGHIGARMGALSNRRGACGTEAAAVTGERQEQQQGPKEGENLPAASQQGGRNHPWGGDSPWSRRGHPQTRGRARHRR